MSGKGGFKRLVNKREVQKTVAVFESQEFNKLNSIAFQEKYGRFIWNFQRICAFWSNLAVISPSPEIHKLVTLIKELRTTVSVVEWSGKILKDMLEFINLPSFGARFVRYLNPEMQFSGTGIKNRLLSTESQLESCTRNRHTFYHWFVLMFYSYPSHVLMLRWIFDNEKRSCELKNPFFDY